jgi:hypothetical protein
VKQESEWKPEWGPKGADVLLSAPDMPIGPVPRPDPLPAIVADLLHLIAESNDSDLHHKALKIASRLFQEKA